jgi:superfamily II DNA or RNA helicase
MSLPKLIIVTTYSQLTAKNNKYYYQNKWTLVILDKVHKIQNRAT